MKRIIWIEDRPESVANEIEYCERHGFKVTIVSSAVEIKEELTKEPDEIAMIIVDVMLFNVMNLETIEINNSDTNLGYRAGLIIIDRLLRPVKLTPDFPNLKSTPILIVSTRGMENEMSFIEQIRKRNGASIDCLEKGKYYEKEKKSWREIYQEKINSIKSGK